MLITNGATIPGNTFPTLFHMVLGMGKTGVYNNVFSSAKQQS
jgi:hypothetical protein